MADMTGSRDVAQAAHLRAELWRHVEELSAQLEKAERRERRLSARSHRQSRQMRAELYTAHHLIDALNHRFPDPQLNHDDDAQLDAPSNKY
jgi:hypothetical protein